MADHLVQVDGLGALGQGAEEAAGLDLRELLVVADQDELRLGRLGVADQAGEGGGVHHPRLVDQEDRAGGEGLVAAASARSSPASRRATLVASRPSERRTLAARQVGRRDPQLDPGRRPALGGGDGGVGLAGAGLADHDDQPLAAGEQAA